MTCYGKEYGKDYCFHRNHKQSRLNNMLSMGLDMALERLWVDAGYPIAGGITLSTYFDKENKKWGGRDISGRFLVS